MSFFNDKNNYSQNIHLGKEDAQSIHPQYPQIVIPHFDIYTEEHHQALLKNAKKQNTLSPLPPPSFELFEHIGQDEKFQEECSDRFFCEILLLSYPTAANASVLFFQNSLHKLILSKHDFEFFNEFFISKNKEPHNTGKINASIGAIHYIYLLYYDWLSSLKDFSNSEDYQNKLIHFFYTYNLTHKFILKYELEKQIKYTSNFFNQNTKAHNIFQDLLTVGQYISAYIQSQFTLNTHLFRTKLQDVEIEYLSLVKQFILDGENDLGKNEELKITQEQLISICKSSLVEYNLTQIQSGLWIHLNELHKFYLYAQRYNLLKKLHSLDNSLSDDDSEDGSSDSGGNHKGTQLGTECPHNVDNASKQSSVPKHVVNKKKKI